LNVIANRNGFTLVEVLVAMAIGAMVVTAAYSLFFTSNRTSMVQEELSEAQQNARVAMERLARDIRTAGFGLPEPPFSLTIDGTTFTSPVTVTNSSNSPDKITLLGIGYKAGVLKKNGTADCNETGDSLLCLSSVEKFLNDSSSFKTSRKYISIGGIEYIELSSAQTTTDLEANNLALASNLSGKYGDVDKVPVYIIQAVEYSIATDLPNQDCSVQNPCLVGKDFTDLRGAGRWAVAENIEDIQFAYGVDANPRDGKIDFAGSYDEGDFLDAPADDNSIIAVRINVIGRTRHIDPAADSFSLECREDRADDTGCTGASDGYRRRPLSKVVKIRNPRTGA